MNIPLLLAAIPASDPNASLSSSPNIEPGSGVAGIVLIPAIIIGIVLLIFWVKSLIHLIKHPDVPNRTLWIILHFVGLNSLAGIIYHFAVRKPYERNHASQSGAMPAAASNLQTMQPGDGTPAVSTATVAPQPTAQPATQSAPQAEQAAPADQPVQQQPQAPVQNQNLPPQQQ